jgi:hypothetical protein
MRSHDRTLLSSLGFNDPDKKDPRHDLACRYISQREIAGKVVAAFNTAPRPVLQKDSTDEYEGVTSRTYTAKGAAYECPISKGDGQYKVTIGFVDVVISAQRATHDKGRGRHRHFPKDWSDWQDTESLRHYNAAVGVEVKIGEVGAGEIIRQVNLYREHLSFEGFVVATAFPLSEGGAEQLRIANILHFVLGKGFERFCAIEDAKAPAQSPEL